MTKNTKGGCENR